MISSLRSEACSGSMDDLAHVVTDCQMADCLTKDKPKAMEGLKKAVETGRLPQVDTHPPFRVLMQNKHKAYASYECTDELISWLVCNVRSHFGSSHFGSSRCCRKYQGIIDGSGLKVAWGQPQPN